MSTEVLAWERQSRGRGEQFLAVLARRPGVVRENPQGRRQEEYLQRALDDVAKNFAGTLMQP